MNATDANANAAAFADRRAGEALDTVRTCITLFGAVGGIVLATVAVMAATGHPTTAFMWVRGAVLFLATFLLHRYLGRVRAGDAEAFDRLRTLSAVAPVAVVGVDLVPGLCPAWYAVLQGLSALALVGVAVLTRGAALRAAFRAAR